MSERHYGLEVGDRVTYPTMDLTKRASGTVMRLDRMDNNRAFVRFDGDDCDRPCVAEWCEKVDQ